MCISHRGQKELKFIKRMQLLKTRTTTKQKSGVSEPMGQSALQNFFLSEKTRAVETRGTGLAIVPADYGRNRSKSFFFKWLWLQQLAPSRLSNLPHGRTWQKFACKKMYFAYYKKNHAKIVSLTGFLLLAQLYYATNHFVNLGIWDQDSD